MSVPFGTLPSGAPCAVQLVGRPGSEAALLELAGELEKLRPWQRTAPLDQKVPPGVPTGRDA